MNLSNSHLKFRNVNAAFERLGVEIKTALAADEGGFVPGPGHLACERTESRNGPVLRFIEPLVICYDRPWERVLFHPDRDANPFFHLFESLWMLSGSKNLEAVAFYSSNMRNYSDDGKELNGAYGYRWRNAVRTGLPNSPVYDSVPRVDQLDYLIEHLRQQPNSRRAVLQMWNVEDDLLKIGGGTDTTSRDVCCNLSACFSLRNGFLNMTVFNRSNDLLWGTFGANVVHFSFLQEYIANALSVPLGTYYQISNDSHVYLDKWKPEFSNNYADLYRTVIRGDVTMPLLRGVTRAEFDAGVKRFVDRCGGLVVDTGIKFNVPFLDEVAYPLCLAFAYHKQRNYARAKGGVALVYPHAPDWATACLAWLERREARFLSRT